MKKTNNNRIISRLVRKAAKENYNTEDLEALDGLCCACNTYIHVAAVIDDILKIHEKLKDAFRGNCTPEDMTDNFTGPIPMSLLGNDMGNQEYDDDVQLLKGLAAELSKEVRFFQKVWNDASREVSKHAILTRGPNNE